MLAAVPNFDYRVGAPAWPTSRSRRSPREPVVVNAGAIERNNEVVKKAMKDNAGDQAHDGQNGSSRSDRCAS